MALRLLKDRRGGLSIAILVAISLTAVFAPYIAPYDPAEQHWRDALSPPSRTYLLGTDDLGRDVLSRLMFGARISLGVGVLAVLLGAVVGITTGLIAGYFRGWSDTLIMRAWDVLLAYPGIIIGIALVAVLGPGPLQVAYALAIVNMPQFARITRASVLQQRELDYVHAARALGATHLRIVLRHVFPNCLGPILVQLSLSMGFAVLLEAALSFIGLGAQPPTPSWGLMLNVSRQYLGEAPWFGIFPGLALAVFLMALNFLADALRDNLNPKGRTK